MKSRLAIVATLVCLSSAIAFTASAFTSQPNIDASLLEKKYRIELVVDTANSACLVGSQIALRAKIDVGSGWKSLLSKPKAALGLEYVTSKGSVDFKDEAIRASLDEKKMDCLKPYLTSIHNYILFDTLPEIAWKGPNEFVTSVKDNADIYPCYTSDPNFSFVPGTASIVLFQNSQSEGKAPENEYSVRHDGSKRICLHLRSRPTLNYSRAAIGGYVVARQVPDTVVKTTPPKI